MIAAVLRFLRRGRATQQGYTLIEVVASVVILGIIMVPLGTAMAFAYRTVFGMTERMAQTTDVRVLSTYFPSDVASVDTDGVNPTRVEDQGICKATASEQSLITFRWDKDLGENGQTVVRYLARGSGLDSELLRRACHGSDAPNETVLAKHFGEEGSTEAATFLRSEARPDVQTPLCGVRECSIDIHGAYDFHLSAQRRVEGQSGSGSPPSAPLNVHALGGYQRARLFWDAPASDGGQPITGYYVDQQPGGLVGGEATPTLFPATAGNPPGALIEGLTNNQSYTFKVRAVNVHGNGPWSVPSTAITPGPTTPEPPALDTAVGDPATAGRITASWSLPSDYSDGGAALTGFRLTAVNPDSVPTTVTVNPGSARTGGVVGLEDNTKYTVQVSALNTYGESSPSNSITGVVTIPGAPGTPSARYGGAAGTLTLTFAPPTAGDFSYFTNFRAKVASRANAEGSVDAATACPSGAAGTCTLQVTGLSSGQTYSIAVQAQNAAGWGPLSAAATAELTPPTVPSSTIAPGGGTNGGFIGQGNPFFVYANATDASGISAVSANADNVATGQTDVAMSSAGGPWTISGTSYAYRSSSITADASIGAGSKSYSITATDTFANSATQSFSVTVDNTPPTVSLTQVNGSTRTFPWNTNAASLTSVGGACTTGSGNNTTVQVTVTGPTPQTGNATCSSSAWSYTFPSPITSEGTYTLEATQSDYAGNVGTSGQKEVDLDRTGPTIERSIIASTTDTTVGGYIKSGGSYYIYANVTDAISGVASVNANTTNITTGSTVVTLTSGSYTVAGQTYNFRSASRTASSISAGSKSYTITATDNAGGSTGPQTFTVTVDATAPVTSTSVIAADGAAVSGYVGANRPYYVYANVTDAAGVQSATANVSNITTSGATAVPLVAGSYSVGGTPYGYRSAQLTASSSITAGSKSFTVTATDVATLSATTSWTVTVDNTAPTVAITKVNNVSVGSWPYSTNVNVTTVGGTCTTSFTDSTTVDVSIAGADTEDGTATCSSGAWTYTLSSPWSAEGSSTINASQSDYAGNTGNATPRTVTVDRTDPVVTLTTPANGSTTNDSTPSVSGTCTTGQGTVSVAITGPTNTSVNNLTCSGGAWSGTSSALTSGGYSATASQTDAAGNTGTSNTNLFTVDTTAPTVAAAIAPQGITTGGYLSQNEPYYVYANATDSSGVASMSANVAVTSNVLTTGATATPLTTAGGPWTIGGTSYAYRSSLLQSNSSISAGNKTYSVSATDNAGNSGSTNFTVAVDNTAPAPTMTQVNGSTRTFPYFTNANVTSVGGTCGTTAGDVASVSVTIAGVENETGTATCSSGAWTYTLTSAWSAEGSSTVTVSQSDLAGNSGTSAARTVSIDKTTPVVSDTVMASTTDTTVGGYVKQGGSYYVYASVSDAASGVSTVTGNVTNITTGTTATSLTTTGGPWTVAGTSYNYRSSALTASNPLTAGTKTYTVSASDVAGNSTTTPNQNVTVDNTAPAPSAFSLANGDQLGRIDIDDSFTVSYNSVVNPSTICTGLTDSNNVTGVTIVLNGNSGSDDTLNAPGSPCSNFFSSVNLKSSYYNTSSTRTLTTTFSWSGSTNSVTVTITALSTTTSRSTNVPADAPTYTPKSSILDPAGNAMGTSVFTGSSSRF